MTTTQNLHLPQWEADDRIMRTDFNDAMASIDAALAEKANSADLPAAISAASPIVKLKDVTLGADTTQWNIDMSDIDLSQYHRLELYFTGRVGWPTQVSLRVNGLSTGYYYDSQQRGTMTYLARGQMTSIEERSGPLIFSIYLSKNTVAGAVTYGYPTDSSPIELRVNTGGCFLPIAVEDITALTLVTEHVDSYFFANSNVGLYGLKK